MIIVIVDEKIGDSGILLLARAIKANKLPNLKYLSMKEVFIILLQELINLVSCI